MDTIDCRAHIAIECSGNNIPVIENSGTEEEIDHRDDGTYIDGTIVCMSCYVVAMKYSPSGKGLTHEISAAIDAACEDCPPHDSNEIARNNLMRMFSV